MDDQNQSSQSSPNNNNQPSSRTFRVRRPSSSLISSTTSTSPMVIPPGAGAALPLSSFQVGPSTSRASSSRIVHNNNSSNIHHHDTDDDVQPSSSTSSFNFIPRRAQPRSSSPLGSPDTTYHWSPNNNSYSGLQDPPTPGGMCVSSTTDDNGPPSPYSPPEPNIRSLSQFRNNNNSIPSPSPVMLPPAPPPRSSSSLGSLLQDRITNHEIMDPNPLPPPAPVAPAPSSSSSTSSNNFCSSIALNSMSPLKNKIKKASSFERFSAQAQASSSAREIVPASHSEPINSPNIPEESSIPGPSRLMWEYHQSSAGPNPSSSVEKPKFVSSISETASLVLSSLTTKPFHIKKLAAKLANVIEQKQQQQQQLQQAAETNNNLAVNQEPMDEPPPPQPPISEPLIRRQLSESPLNLTDSAATAAAGSGILNGNNETVISRNPIAKTFLNKNIPMTPKQKLLQRMQSGEIIIPSSNTPPPVSVSPPPPQISVDNPPQLLLSNYQHQHQLIVPEPLNMDPSSPNMCGMNPYESFMRSNDDLLQVQEEDIPKSVDNAVNQILYDPGDPYPYNYYGNLQGLPEDFFINSSGNIPNMVRNSHYSIGVGPDESMNHPHANQHLEFVMGLSRDCDDDDGQLNETPDHQQFLDPNEINLTTNKSQQQQQNANDSTLRNLLMMDSLARSNDDSWISVAATQEYHNRFGSSSGLRLGNSSSNNGLGSGWVNDWPSRNSWQGQGADDNDQDEVMDMSVMDIEKSSHGGIISSRLIGTHHHQQFSSQSLSNSSLVPDDEMPMIFNPTSSIPMPLPLDLQQHYTNSSAAATISSQQHKQINQNPYLKNINPNILDHLQQSHRSNNYEDEPVNLMSATLVEQALSTHHQLHKNSSDGDDSEIDLVLSRNNSSASDSSMRQQLLESQSSDPSSYDNCISEPNILFTTTSTTSTTVTAGFDGGVLQLPDTIEERRIIRVPKKYEHQSTLMVNFLDQANEQQRATKSNVVQNLVPDKPVAPKSHASIPSILSLEPNEDGKYKVVASERIRADTTFGPVEGPVTTLTRDDLNLVLSTKDYPAFLMVDNLNTLLQVDKQDDKYCNWMKHTRLAQSPIEQNAFIYEDKGLLYFTTCKDIPPKTELKVGYGADYAFKYKLSSLEFDPTVIEPPPPPPPQDPLQIVQEIPEKQQFHFSCSECDLNFSCEDELGKHIYSDHNDNDNGFRKPKKKAIKVYNSIKQSLAAGIEKENVKRQAAESSMGIGMPPVKKQKKQQQEKVQSSAPKMEPSSNQEESSPIVGSSSGESEKTPVLPSSSTSNKGKSKCSVCYKVFATIERLDKHSIVHSKEFTKPLECKYCPKRFLTNSALAGHAKSHKEVGNSFECPLCTFITQGLAKLKDHVQMHKDEIGEFTCPYCPQKKKFPAYPLIRKHIRAFHGPRLFGCSSCDKRFPNADKLKLHELKHSNFKAYLCAECGKQFKRKDKLADHMRKSHTPGKKPARHPTPEPPQTPQPESKSPQDQSDDKKFSPRLTAEELIKYTFRCLDCMRGFRRRGMLVNHLAKRHPEKNSSDIPELNMPITRPAKNFECLYCDKVYKSSSKRKCHIQKNHPGKEVPPPSRGKDLTSLLENSTNAGAEVIIKNMKAGVVVGFETLKKTVNQVIRKETIVGKIVGVPHPCEWCYRQYATRAKLLQHQRKQHYDLMPKDIQMPRTQKNNVMKSANEDGIGNIDEKPNKKSSKVKKSIKKENYNLETSAPAAPTSTTNRVVLETVSTSTMDESASQSQSYNENNVIGYLVTNGDGSSDLRLLSGQDIVMGIIPQQNSPSSNHHQLIESSNDGPTTTKTITVCIPSGTSLTDANTYITHMISNGISVNGNQILTTKSNTDNNKVLGQ